MTPPGEILNKNGREIVLTMGKQLYCGVETLSCTASRTHDGLSSGKIVNQRKGISAHLTWKIWKIIFLQHWVSSDIHTSAKLWWPPKSYFSGCPSDTEYDFSNKKTHKSSLIDKEIRNLAQKRHENVIFDKSYDHTERSLIFGYF